MRLKNKIRISLCMALAMVSFLHPFFGKYVYAEEPEENEIIETEMVSEETVSEETEEEEDFEAPALMSLSARSSNLGISDTAPKAGQENKYEFSENDTTWTVPASGYYDLYCYGAQGGTGGYDRGVGDKEDSYANVGNKGAVRGARAFLEKGTELVIQAGQQPAGSSCSYGEGSTNGETWWNSVSQSINGYQISYSETLRRGKEETGSKCGSRTFARGYPDGGYGNSLKTVCDSDSDHSGGAVGGGGGGSSYILCNGTKILSAQGGAGGAAHYECPDGKGTAGGGNGGGVTILAEAEGIIWHTEELDETESNRNSGHGYVLIHVVNVAPMVELEEDVTDWVSENVTITATIKSEGQGLLHPCYSWEADEEGNDIWTEEASYTVSQNGIYTCKVRDVEGNIGEALIEITNIDRLQPQGEMTADITDWTKEKVELSIVADDGEETVQYGKSGLAEAAYLWGRVEESGETVWQEAWSDSAFYDAFPNGTYLCRVRDKAGNENRFEYKVTNIDVTAPEAEFEKTDKWYGGKTEVLIYVRDIQPDGTLGCGPAAEAYSFDGIEFVDRNKLEIEKEGVYQVWVRDELGNVKMWEQEFLHDKKIKNEKEKEENAESKSEQMPQTIEEIVEKTVMETVHVEKEEHLIPVTETIVQNPNEEIREVVQTALENTEENTVSALGEIEEQALDVKSKSRQEVVEKDLLQLPEWKEKRQERELHLKRILLYSVWMAVVFCGLLWMLFGLVLEHVVVYRKDENGKYRKVGRCLIIRKKEYIQINLIPLMRNREERDYKICFAWPFVLVHKKEKVLIRTWQGVELRNVKRNIELLF